MKNFLRVLFSLLVETKETSWELIKITVPVVIVTKILEEFGLIILLSNILEPVMNLVGLPGSMGLVWTTAILTNIYGAMVAFAALAPMHELTVAQTTIICSIILIAHALPLELAITQRAGAPFLPIALLRLLGAFFYGFLLHLFCSFFSIWQEPATLLFQAENFDNSHLGWLTGQLENILLIILVIFLILIIMRILRAIGFITMMEKGLEPILPIFGMSAKAAPITVVGMVLGISYGGALIIRETKKGEMSRKDVFFSLALMGLSHSLVEDTLMMMALGGHFVGLFLGRVLFSLIVMFLLARLLSKKRNYLVSVK